MQFNHKNHIYIFIFIIVLLQLTGCENNPYPKSEENEKIFYSFFQTPPKSLDPANVYTRPDMAVSAPINEALFEFHYLKRPFELIPSLAKDIPDPEPIIIVETDDGPLFRSVEERESWAARPETNNIIDGIRYRLDLQEDVLYQDDACFGAFGDPDLKTRTMTAEDYHFTFCRLADPKVNSQCFDTFSRIYDFKAFSERVEKLRADPANENKPVSEIYKAAGSMQGIPVQGELTFDVILKEQYPQLIYWFTMSFASPVPPEAADYYNGKNGREDLSTHPVGTGPYILEYYDNQSKHVLTRNPNYRGALHPERKYPGTYYPYEGGPGDKENGLLEDAGKPLPFYDKINYVGEKERIPYFNKFLQGYYDSTYIIKESFDQVIQGDDLSDEMREKGVRLGKSMSMVIRQMGFNMTDDILGAPEKFSDLEKEAEHDLWIERNRYLRQAMALAYNAEEEIRIFDNGRGLAAQAPIPPGVLGYDPEYKNPYRQYDPELKLAKDLLEKAGYPNGEDPKTGKPLKLTLTTAGASTASIIFYSFIRDNWRKLGLDVELRIKSYNEFRKELYDGSFQIYKGAWVADYPDPENFLFLLYGEYAYIKSGGLNRTNFMNDRYDRYFEQLRYMQNDESATFIDVAKDGTEKEVTMTRKELVQACIDIVAEEVPWIMTTIDENYILYQPWHENVKASPIFWRRELKYRKVDPVLRNKLRDEWNNPIMWPLYVIIIGFIVLLIPGIFTYFRERQ